MSNHKNTLKTSFNDVTGDTIKTGKGSQEKYAEGWEGIFRRKQDGPPMEIGHFMVDDTFVQRMQEALSQPSTMIPSGLSHEELREFILGEGSMVDRNPHDDALFADMHTREEQFSVEAVREAFKNVPRREPAFVKDSFPKPYDSFTQPFNSFTMPPAGHSHSVVMALDFHDGAK